MSNITATRRSSKLARREAIEGYLFISPWIFGFLVFIAGPLIASILLSFSRWDIVTPSKLIGIKNYGELFTKDELFRQSLKVTIIYTVFSVPLRLAFALFVAVFLNRKIRALSYFRTVIYMPEVVSGVALAIMWLWIFNPEFGVLNSLLSKIGIQGPAWIFSITWALPSFILMSIWKIGGTMVIYLAGLQGIPTQLYEAAEIDGANEWHKFWKVTLPMLSPVIFFTLIINMIGSFQIFAESFVMTKGGPGNATLFYVLYLYRNAFEYFRMGYASALAWILFLVILVFTLLIFRSSAWWVYYEAETKGR